jgi:DNA-binding transcriptional LysR family regulator
MKDSSVGPFRGKGQAALHCCVHMFDRLAAPYLTDRSLVQVLPQHTMPETPFVIYFPRYANEQPKLRAFINVAREVMRAK